MNSFNINYFSAKSELCEIGKKYDTDKSSQRSNVTNQRHCHPYTLFYNTLFKNYRNEHLNIAELGILDGGSLRMWQEYFPNANLYGFEYNLDFINNFKQKFDNSRITLLPVNVNDPDSIIKAFEGEMLYDIIIEDTTHQFEDQIRVIENVYNKLKPGGIMIIEDIFKRYTESDYLNRIKNFDFQKCYFVSLDHANRNSTGWDNDKLLILVKGGAEPIFKNDQRMTIITPSYRTQNLQKIKESINFDYLNEWIIIYDETKIPPGTKLFDHPKIKEYTFKGPGISGNPQRNFALNTLSHTSGMLYFLDDDNIVHPGLFNFMEITESGKIYTFDQTDRLLGNNIKLCHIDTAMMLIDYSLCTSNRWKQDIYGADGIYIEECYNLNKNKHIYINNNLCYYNKLN
jgi:phospholipid N-methyltransferase